jgi:hypothetical protein
MEPLSALVVAVSAVAAYGTKALVNALFKRFKATPKIEITTAAGHKITVDASQLTQEKVAEITGASSNVRTAY